LLREEEGLAARVLESLDITLERVRTQVVRIVGSRSKPATRSALERSTTRSSQRLTRPARPRLHPVGRPRASRPRPRQSQVSPSCRRQEQQERDDEPGQAEESAEPGEREPKPVAPLRFKQALVRLHPGERRGITLLSDPEQIPPGTLVNVAVDPGLSVNLSSETIPDPVRSGFSRIDANVRCRVSCDPGARLTVLAEAGGQLAELVVLVVRHHASGWVREIARKDEDSETEATFDPESGIVTVYEGRREFKARERAARRSGLAKRRVREYLPYRMLEVEVEVAANAVYSWAAGEILARRHGEERPADAAQYAAAAHHEAQALRYRAHEKLMCAFLDEEVFDGRVRIDAPTSRRTPAQSSLLDPSE